MFQNRKQRTQPSSQRQLPLPNGQNRSRSRTEELKNAPQIVDLVGDDDSDDQVEQSMSPPLTSARFDQKLATRHAEIERSSSAPSKTEDQQKQTFRHAFKSARRTGVFCYKKNNIVGVKRRRSFTNDDKTMALVAASPQNGASNCNNNLGQDDIKLDLAPTATMENTTTISSSLSTSSELPLNEMARFPSPNKQPANTPTERLKRGAKAPLSKNRSIQSRTSSLVMTNSKTYRTGTSLSHQSRKPSPSSRNVSVKRQEALPDSLKKTALQPTRFKSPPPPKRPPSSTCTKQSPNRFPEKSTLQQNSLSCGHDHANDATGNIPPVLSLESVEGSCWACHVPLRVPAGQICFYEAHDHPVMHVPVCCLCCDEIAALQIEFQTNKNDDNCLGCGRGVNDDDEEGCCLFMCDSCDFAFCFQCVARANGGGTVGKETAQQLQRDVDEAWKCLACETPILLLQVRQQLEELARQKSATTTAEDLISQLDALETEKDRCINELENNEYTQENVLRRELSPKCSGVELEEAIEAALDEWREEWARHEARIASKIASIQDVLDTEHEVDLVQCYKKCLGGWEPVEEDQKLPEWAKAADRVIQKREMANESVPDYCVQDPSVYELEDLKDDDVEDLDPSEPEDSLRLRKAGWSRGRPSQKSIKVALLAENERIRANRIRLKCSYHESEDVNMTREEELFASGGPSRRRRDVIQIIQPKLKKNTSFTKKGALSSNQSSGVSSHPRASTTVASPPPRADTSSYSTTTNHVAEERESTLLDPQRELNETEVNGSLSSALLDEEGDISQPDKSAIILCSQSEGNGVPIRTVAVVDALGKHLKPHQIAGVKFMWKCVFSDFESFEVGNSQDENVGGVVLAHNMGLGKSLSAICIIHTVLTSKSMQSLSGEPLVKTVLLICPVNTLSSWETEFTKWLGSVRPFLAVHNISLTDSKSRHIVAQRWRQQGGVLLMSFHLFVTLLQHKDQAFGEMLQPDVLVMDEAHLMLKSKNSETYRGLSQVMTPRRIALTGSPFQNNLFEYFRMIKFIRPNAIPIAEESIFEREFVTPILNGLNADSSARHIEESDSKTEEFLKLVSPFVHRVDASELMKDLPPLQQAVLHVRQTRIQVRLFSAYRRLQNGNDVYKNFFRTFQQLMPVCNHPACLLEKGHEGQRTQEQEENGATDWWRQIVLKSKDDFFQVESGAKFLLLLHIIAYAELHQEKVLIFSKCLKTLDFVEKVFAIPDWSHQVSSLKEHFPNVHLGGWVKNTEYCRIDGQTSAAERGELINKCNDSSADGGGVRAFLISVLAGGLGINLYSASRVVLLDSHFNPSVTTQAIYRAYRYGQTLPVHCYRLLTEGTMEEKVYRRAVNKSGVANRVIDKKSIRRNFTANEVRDLQSSYTWAQCDKCDKWRMLFSDTPGDELPDKWFCSMNELDPVNNTCAASEKSQRWYEMNAFSRTGEQAIAVDNVGAMSDSEKQTLAQNDDLLLLLLKISCRSPKNSSQQASTVVSQYYFHEALLSSELSKKPTPEEASTISVKKEERGVSNPRITQTEIAATSQESIIDLCSSDEDEGSQHSDHPFDEMFI